MKEYKHIFFDLDHTLWDYDTNAASALEELHEHYDLRSRSGFLVEQLVQTFFKVNELLWDDFNLGRIGREEIRRNRFPMIYEILDAPLKSLPENIEAEYIALAPTKKVTFPFAHELLSELNENYGVHLITNGFDDIQSTKLKSAELTNYFEVIVTSETAGFRKPNAEIFEFALGQAKAKKEESLMIGDNLVSDIGGARSYGMDQVFFNPNRVAHEEEITHEIQSLEQLKELL